MKLYYIFIGSIFLSCSTIHQQEIGEARILHADDPNIYVAFKTIVVDGKKVEVRDSILSENSNLTTMQVDSAYSNPGVRIKSCNCGYFPENGMIRCE
jgi:hypothetical protein